MLRTYQPRKRHRSKVHGFRKRMATANGRKVFGPPPCQGQKCALCLMSDRSTQSRLPMYYSGVDGIISIRPLCLSEGIFRP